MIVRFPLTVDEAEDIKPVVNVESPAVERVPVKLAVEDIVCPLIVPVVSAPNVEAPATDRPPNEAVCANRFVDEAVVAKKLVEVALVDVDCSAVKF